MPANSVLDILSIDQENVTSGFRFLAVNGNYSTVVMGDIDNLKHYTIDELEQRVSRLEYIEPNFQYFYVNGQPDLTVEKGEYFENITLSWDVIGTNIESLYINNSIGYLPSSANSYVANNGPYSANSNNSSWQIMAISVDADSDTRLAYANTAITYLNKIYWGTSTNSSIADSGIIALAGQDLGTNKNKTVYYDCSGGKYVYYAFPQELGAISLVIVNGSNFSDYIQYSVSFTNSHGYTEPYYVYKFQNIQYGKNIRVEWI